MPENFWHFQWTVHLQLARTMSLKCWKISGTFIKICGTSAMKGQSPTSFFLEVPLNYSTFYFCAIAVHWTCSEIRMLINGAEKKSQDLDNLAIARHYYYEKLHTFRGKCRSLSIPSPKTFPALQSK